ncbi:hypothetical protein [Gelidibacter sp.]|uniref:hypothetical protein n=1 Tax=Gelidibacter sp. TaxID=2018083 RepID=UPI002C9F6D47|nr:hypothetical protein [Gelidibacter sp.]HUH28438.1 hypothetical protein [Gelidibacter sp.]
MGKQIVIIILGLFAFTTSCKTGASDLNPNYPDEIINSWLESYEEADGTYRPSDYKSFPESRYRQVYKFMEKNTCEYSVLSPEDAHDIENGFWEYIEDENVINVYNQNMKLHEKLKVISISANLLQLDSVNP